jgi:hypothetical protein
MIYEGIVEIFNDLINIDLIPERPQAGSFALQMDNDPSLLASTIKHLKPHFPPDEPSESSESYASKLCKQGYGTFLTSSPNIHDLVTLYATTPPKEMNPFPGLATPRKSGEIVFTETIHNFKGLLNGKPMLGKTVQFTYRGVLR